MSLDTVNWAVTTLSELLIAQTCFCLHLCEFECWPLYHKRSKCNSYRRGGREEGALHPQWQLTTLVLRDGKSIFFFLFCNFKGNDKLTWMNLSHNKFSEKSGENLGLGISEIQITLLYIWLLMKSKKAHDGTKSTHFDFTSSTGVRVTPSGDQTH